jgi:hypothetical protein
MIRDYQDICICFENKKCKLLTTKEEFETIKQNCRQPKYKYIASCGHEHNVFFNVFLNRNTGVVCPTCINIVNRNNQLKKSKNDKLTRIKQELNCINYFIELVKEHYAVKKAYDGCKSDIILKPIGCDIDEWLGVQVKTCEKAVREYSFHLDNKEYSNLLMLFICKNDKKMWGIPYDIIKGKIKLSIGISKSKYEVYELNNNNIVDYIRNFYNINVKKSFDELNTPINIYQQREQSYRIFREDKIDFIKFINNDMEGLVYDFFINDKKIQEKVGSLYNNSNTTFQFHIVKSNGVTTSDNSGVKKRGFTQYELGDNDFYWLNCDNKKDFYVFPEKILFQHQFIGGYSKKVLKINTTSKYTNKWFNQYAFDYENIDKERLMNIIGL